MCTAKMQFLSLLVYKVSVLAHEGQEQVSIRLIHEGKTDSHSVMQGM